MARKDRSFAAKVAKSTAVKGETCPVCESLIQPVIYIKSERSPHTGAWRFRESVVKVCKCNHKKIYG
jgi:hypothetical protein